MDPQFTGQYAEYSQIASPEKRSRGLETCIASNEESLVEVALGACAEWESDIGEVAAGCWAVGSRLSYSGC